MAVSSTHKQPATSAVIGFAAAFAIMIIWSGWLVTSRAGVQTSLTVSDLLAFRFGIASIIALPVILYVKPWRGMTLRQIFITTAVMGIPYSVILFNAFKFAPAAHGAVFMNGMLPALTMLISLWLFSERPRHRQLLGAGLILTGAGLAAFGTAGFDFSATWRGDLMFIAAGAFFAMYMILNRLWHITMTQIWLCGSLINAVLFVPVWWLFLPSGIAQAPMDQLLLQMGYQGIVPNIFGLVLISIAVRHVGPSVTAAVMSGVPAVGALLGYIFLGEQLTWLGILSLCILTPGIIIASLPARPKPHSKS